MEIEFLKFLILSCPFFSFYLRYLVSVKTVINNKLFILKLLVGHHLAPISSILFYYRFEKRKYFA